MPAFGAILLMLSAVLVLSVALEVAAVGLGFVALFLILAGLGVAGIVAASLYLAGSEPTMSPHDELERWSPEDR